LTSWSWMNKRPRRLWKIGDRSAWRAVSVREDNRGTDPGFVLFFGKRERFSRGDKAASCFLWRRESGVSGPRVWAKPFPAHVSCRFAAPDEDRAAGNAPGRRTTGKRPASRKNFFMDGNEPGQPGKSSMRLRRAHPWLCLKMNVARFIWRGKFSKVSLRGRPSPVAKPSPWHRSLFFPG